MNTIITIGRQLGSGGKEIGKGLAEALGIPFYDEEIVKMVAESGKKSSAVRGYSVCPRRAEAQVPDWVCRASWRQLSQPDLPSLHLSPF